MIIKIYFNFHDITVSEVHYIIINDIEYYNHLLLQANENLSDAFDII